uniref:Pop1 N-terminal domain-containing protein n=1 Tax=Aureoumbra lagunensis TaxID=44058 RepID=A0A7S3JSY4_9STRA
MDAEATHLNVLEFAKARLPELKVIESTLKDLPESAEVPTSVRKTARHLRRRTRAHDSNDAAHPNKKRKRVIRNPKATKPTRRVRRSSLVQSRSPHTADEEGENNDKNRLLETHIWHAKRFRMMNCDGFIVPECRNDRGFRAAARSLRQHCVCFDATHYRPLVVMRSVLEKVCPDSVCTTQHGVYLYQMNSFPDSALGPCMIHTQEKEEIRISVPPRIYGYVKTASQGKSIPGGVLRFQLRGPQSMQVAQTVRYQHAQVELKPIGEENELWSGVELSLEPGGSGANVWNAIIKAGAHAIGASEVRFLRSVEIGLPTFPYDDQDALPCLDKTKIFRCSSINDLDASWLIHVRILALRTGLPADTDNIFADTTTSTILGRLTTAGFASSLGRGAGIGLASFRAVAQLPKFTSLQQTDLPATVIKSISKYHLEPRCAFFQNAHSPNRHACILIPIFSASSSWELPASSSSIIPPPGAL